MCQAYDSLIKYSTTPRHTTTHTHTHQFTLEKKEQQSMLNDHITGNACAIIKQMFT